MIYIGIDPGQTGAMGVLADNEPYLISPVVFDFDGTETLVWLKTIARSGYNSQDKVYAIIEKVNAMPRQGVSSTFKFGTNYGRWIGRLEAFGIPFDFVTPTKWKRAMFDSMPKSDQKAMSLDRARRLFPVMTDRLKRKKDHNRAEALLLAEYCRRHVK